MLPEKIHLNILNLVREDELCKEVEMLSCIFFWIFLTGCKVEKRCEKIDFLFVIDNSGSMGTHQTHLIEHFPDFIEGIRDLSSCSDYHVAVVTTDNYQKNPPECRELGDLVQNTAANLTEEEKAQGINSKPCLSNGRAYLTDKDDLKKGFSCLANVGVDGNGHELSLEAFNNAVLKERSCNKGFMREDALLVTTILTDENAQIGILSDTLSAFGVDLLTDKYMDQYAQTILESKDGLPNQVVVLALHSKAPEQSDKIVEFTQSFPIHYHDSIDIPSYKDFFLQAASHVDKGCRNYDDVCRGDECCIKNSPMEYGILASIPLFSIFITFALRRHYSIRYAKEGKGVKKAQNIATAIGLWLCTFGSAAAIYALAACVPPYLWPVIGILGLFSLVQTYVALKG